MVRLAKVSVGKAILVAAAVAAVIMGTALATRRPRMIASCLFAAGSAGWGAGLLFAASGQSVLHPVIWAVAAAVCSAAGAGELSLPVTQWLSGRTHLDEVRRILEASMLAAAAALLVSISIDATIEARSISAPWLAIMALHMQLLAVLVAHVVRDGNRRLLGAAAGAAAQIAADAVVMMQAVPGHRVSSGWLTGLSIHALLSLLGWCMLFAGTARIQAITDHRSQSSRSSQLDSLAGPRNVVAAVALAGLTAASVMIALGTHAHIGLLHVVLLMASVVSFCLHEVVRNMQQRDLVLQLQALAATDPLTGLGNRRALSAAIATVYSGSAGPVSVLTIDLDNFKMINTLLGHHTGDELLIAVAHGITAECAHLPARSFRLGGDEFAVLIQAPPAQATALAHRLIECVAVAAASIAGAARVDVSASIGIAHHPALADPKPGIPDPGDGGLHGGLSDLTRSGDAMRAAKAAGRARVLAYSADMARDQTRHETLERRLRHAIANGDVELHFQPIISLPEMRMVGAESLARWTDAELGPVSPVEFIAVAEDSGLIIELGLQLARQAMELSIQTGAHAAGLVGGVNVSPTQLRSPGFAVQMADLMSELNIRPHQFALEVTESVRIEEDDPAVQAIWKLTELGMPIALDDFGTGYASLSLINRLPVKILKLDRSMTQRLHEHRGLAIARCVTDMARAIQIDVVAEGVETPEHLRAVRDLGVGFGQGWLFERAVSAERFADFVRYPDQVLRHLPAELLAPISG